MAVDSISQPTAENQTAIELHLSWRWLAVAVSICVILGTGYSQVSDRVAEATTKVRQLEGQLRSEQARGDALRVELAQLQTIERLVASASGPLQMDPASAQNVAYVAAPEHIAFRSGAGTAPGENESSAMAWLGRPDARPTNRGIQMSSDQSPATGSLPIWAERLLTAFAPTNVAASERAYQ